MENKPIESKMKVYALLVEGNETLFLSVQYATSLEDAFLQAKLEYERVNPIQSRMGNPLAGGKIGLFTIKSIPDLISESKKVKTESIELLKKEKAKLDQWGKAAKNLASVPIVVEKVPEIKPKEKKEEDISREKNLLMAKIIKDKDKKLFNEFKAILSKAERTYITKQLNKDVK